MSLVLMVVLGTVSVFGLCEIDHDKDLEFCDFKMECGPDYTGKTRIKHYWYHESGALCDITQTFSPDCDCWT